jgi:hypothetical protein
MLRASDIYCRSTLATSGTSVRSLNSPALPLLVSFVVPKNGNCLVVAVLNLFYEWLLICRRWGFPRFTPIQVPWFAVQGSRCINDLNPYANSSLRTGSYDLISFNRYISKNFFPFSVFPQRTDPKTPQPQTQASHTFHDSGITTFSHHHSNTIQFSPAVGITITRHQ